jgi:hypothetical protein
VSAPESVLRAIARVSGRLVCPPSCGTVIVQYNLATDEIEIVHSAPWCECVASPDGAAAVAFARWVQEEIAVETAIGQYGEPLPVHVVASPG